MITVLETCRFGLDGGAMFGVVPKTLWERAYAPADEKNRIPMAAKVLLVRRDNRVILVDTGNCPWMQPKFLDIYGISFSEYSLEMSLRQHNIAPEDVTDVLLTHLHFDHVGGAVLHDGTPRFPNARYTVQKEHLDWARNPTEKDRASFLPEMFEPLVHHGVLDVLDGPEEVFPGIFVEPLYGHTTAMQSVRIVEADTTYFYPADLMPTGAHIGVPYVMGYDNHPLTTIQEKKRLLPTIIDEGWIVVFEHDALRDASRIIMGAKGPQLSDPISLK